MLAATNGFVGDDKTGTNLLHFMQRFYSFRLAIIVLDRYNLVRRPRNFADFIFIEHLFLFNKFA
jgi:hypothetical protein